jgi:hypothetical protein
MKLSKRLFRFCLGGVIIWYFACVGTGLYILPCIYLTMWPVFLLQPLLPTTLPDWFMEYAWPIDALISLIAWVLLAALAAVVSHGILALRSHKI